MKDINKIAIIGDNSERIQIIDIKTKKQFYKLFGKPNKKLLKQQKKLFREIKKGVRYTFNAIK